MKPNLAPQQQDSPVPVPARTMRDDIRSPNGDGIIKVGRRGIRKFEFGDGSGSVTVEMDVTATFDQWVLIDAGFFDEQGKITSENMIARNRACWEWVQGIIMQGAGETEAETAQQVAQRLSLTDALVFMKLLGEEVDKLKAFFTRNTDDKPSSGTNSVDYKVVLQE